MRPNNVIALELPTHLLNPETKGDWIVFEDRYISLGDTLERELGGNTHKVIEVFGFKEVINSNKYLNSTYTVHRQAIKISGKCLPKVGEIFYVNNIMEYEKSN